MSFQKGMGEAVTGIVGSIILSAILTSFAEDGLIPSNMVFFFTFAGFIGAIALMFSFGTTGILFTFGWIIGAWLLKDMLTSSAFIVYFGAPIVALVIRVVSLVKRNLRR